MNPIQQPDGHSEMEVDDYYLVSSTCLLGHFLLAVHIRSTRIVELDCWKQYSSSSFRNNVREIIDNTMLGGKLWTLTKHTLSLGNLEREWKLSKVLSNKLSSLLKSRKLRLLDGDKCYHLLLLLLLLLLAKISIAIGGNRNLVSAVLVLYIAVRKVSFCKSRLHLTACTKQASIV